MTGGTPESDSTAAQNGKPIPSRPAKQIRFKNKSFGLVTQECLDAVAAANKPPTLFQSGGVLVRVRHLDGDVVSEPLTLDALRHHVGRSADFVVVYPSRKAGQKDYVRTDPPPLDIVRDVMACPGWEETVFPVLKGIVRCPYFTAEGELVTAEGYHTRSKLWYAPGADLAIDHVPESPTGEDVAEARRWLLTDLLGDFPFQDEPDRANALGYLLTPFVRELVKGQVPVAYVSAPAAGTGKGLLCNTLAFPALGGPLEVIPQRDSEDEWRKAFTAKLIESPTFILLDNLTGNLRSPALEAILTSDRLTDRLLGESRMVRLILRTIWMITGNNLQLGGDLPRRAVWIRLDAKMERPEDREPGRFKHPNLLHWAGLNRPKLVWSALVLVRNWLSQGAVVGPEVMGSYDSWAGVIGGILRDAEVTGFLKNLTDRRRDSDEEMEEMKQFIYAWGTRYQFAKVTSSDLYKILEDSDLLPYVMSGATESSRKQRLGKYLAKIEGKTAGRFQVTRLPNLHRTGVRLYQLVDLQPERQDLAADSTAADREQDHSDERGDSDLDDNDDLDA